MVENTGPIENGTGPLFGNVHVGQVQQLANGLLRGERSLVFGHFTELAVVAFNGVVGVNQAPDLGREIQYVFLRTIRVSRSDRKVSALGNGIRR